MLVMELQVLFPSSNGLFASKLGEALVNYAFYFA